MTSLRGDVVNRVRRLPKPTRAAEALLPLFEAKELYDGRYKQLMEASGIAAKT